MISKALKYFAEVALLICASLSFVLGGVLLHESDSKLFQETETFDVAKNVEWIQKSNGDFAKVINSLSDSLIAKEKLLESIRVLFKDVGQILIYLALFQFGIALIALAIKNRKIGN